MKPRILFLYDFPFWGSGSGTFLRYLVKNLAAKDYPVGIIAPERRRLDNKIKQFTARPPQMAVFVAHPELKDVKKYADLSNEEILAIYSAYLKRTFAAVKTFKPDIIHVNHLSLISWVARMVKSLTNINYIITSHGSDLHQISQDRRFFHMTRDAIRGASMVTVVSRDSRAWLVKMFGQEFSKKLRTIPGGIELQEQSIDKSVRFVNDKYKLSKKKVVLFTGRLTPQKGVIHLVKAARSINAEVFIIGDGPNREELVKLSKELKIKNVHFLGYMGEKRSHELRGFYCRANVFVAPSVWDEPLGLVILEAMSCNTPVVVTRKGGIPLAVKDGVNGFFVRPRNSKEIAEKVNKILSDTKLEKRMGENARQIVEEKFTWDKTVVKFENIYLKHS